MERAFSMRLAKESMCHGSAPPTSRKSGTASSRPRSGSSAPRAITARPSGTSCARAGCRSGAIYTHFSGKDELIRLSCDQIATRGLDELAERLAPATTTAERLAIAIRLYVETIDDYEGAPGQVSLVQAWAEADREPGVRDMLAARRERLAGAGEMLVHQGVISGELPAWLDVEAATRGFLALLDGLMLQRIEAGKSYRPADLERRAGAILELMLAAGPSRPTLPEPVPAG